MTTQFNRKLVDGNPKWGSFWEGLEDVSIEISSDEVLSKQPVISVWMITFNQQDLIEEAIDSVLFQEFTQPIELVIGDDCSTDGTLEILLDYQEKYPENIRVLKALTNLGQRFGKKYQPNVVRTLAACRAPLIALLEGDDKWITESKLEDQYDLLKDCVELSGCYCECLDLDMASGRQVNHVASRPKTVDLRYLMQNGWFIRTPSLMFRTQMLKPLPYWYLDIYSTDYMLQYSLLRNGDFVKLPKVQAAYRIHEGGVSNADTTLQIQRWREKIALLERLNSENNGIYSNEVKTRCKQLRAKILVSNRKEVGILGTLKELCRSYNSDLVVIVIASLLKKLRSSLRAS
ncbi:MAG: glycosyltransferase [Verrucomicrobiota bacterium]